MRHVRLSAVSSGRARFALGAGCSFALFVLIALTGCGRSEVSSSLAVAELQEGPAASSSSNGAEVTPMVSGRKLIAKVDASYSVADIDEFDGNLKRIVDTQQGFIAERSIEQYSGQRRGGRWQIRIPSNAVESFLDELADFGVSERQSQTIQDVTMEYVDLESRIQNKQQLEQRILSLLEQSTSKIEEVIKVEQELARIRGDIEQMQGRMRVLKDQISLATITISAIEQVDFVPDSKLGFASQIRNTWTDSLNSLQLVATQTFLVVVALTPWVISIGVLSVPVLMWRLYSSRSSKA